MTWLLLAFLSGCATAKSSLAVRTELAELPADRWRATMHFSQPQTSVRFVRDRGEMRTKWTIVEPPGASWKSEVTGDSTVESIVFASPSDRLILELPTNTTDREKDYNLNLGFTDGSRLLYTGHFMIEGADHTWSFRALQDHHIRWNGEGDTYVYFGAIEPVETERMTLVADPGLPAWIGRQVRELVPRQFDYFAAKTGTELSFKPIVFLSYGGDRSPGLSFKGGVLPGLVQIAVDGKEWSTESSQSRELWYSRLAHESFHLWDGQMFVHDDDAEWLSEAAADHAALLAMLDNGVIDEARRKQLLVDAANECVVRLEGKPILEANPRTFYACGVITQLMAGDREVWPVYRRLFVKDHRYTTDEFLRLVPPTTSDAIAKLVRHGLGQPTDVFLAEQLRNAGISVTRIAPEEAVMPQNIGRWMVHTTLGRCACRTAIADRCNNQGGAITINDVDIRRHPERAYGSLLATPESKVMFGKSEVTMRCTAADADPSWEKLLRLEN